MSRPTTISSEQILRVAQKLFLEKGIGATTAEVARRAGVAEGSIFKRWSTKQELFRAAMRPEIEEPEWLETLSLRMGHGDPQEALFDVGLQAIQFFQRLLPLMMMSWSNPTKHSIPPHLEGPNPPPIRALRLVKLFFESEIRARRIRRHDPEILARAFIGGIQNYVFFELLMRANDEESLPPRQFLRGLVKLLWVGAKPQSRKG